MKYFLGLALMLVIGYNGLAQLGHFIYIQSDSKQVFSVKTGDKVFKSSSTGYVILPQLPEGNRALTVSFPESQFAPQTFSLVVNGDAGYSLKNFGEKGWGLFNLQTLAIQMNDGQQTAAPVAKASPKAVELTKDEPKVVEAAKVVDEHQPTPSATPKPAEVVQLISPPVSEVVQPTKAAQPTATIKRTMLICDKDGVAAAYEVQSDGKMELVRILIPGAQLAEAAASPKPAKIENANTINVAESKPVSVVPPTTDKPQVFVTCHLISNEDFISVRKKLAAQSSDEKMLKQAQKAFKANCFTVDQVKDLGNFFSGDDNRLKFLEAALPAIPDKSKIDTLASLLSLTESRQRFQQMIQP